VDDKALALPAGPPYLPRTPGGRWGTLDTSNAVLPSHHTVGRPPGFFVYKRKREQGEIPGSHQSRPARQIKARSP